MSAFPELHAEVKAPSEKRLRVANPEELQKFVLSGEIESMPDHIPAFPLVAAMNGTQCTHFISLEDFYPTQESTIEKLYMALDWYRDIFNVKDTAPVNLNNIRKLQRFLNDCISEVAAVRGEARRNSIALEHARMRFRAKRKKKYRDLKETATDAEMKARIDSQEIDELHTNAIRYYEEMKGLYDRLQSTLIGIAQDRKAMQFAFERGIALSQY